MALLAAAVILLSAGNVTPDEQTTLLAHQVGVDPLELQGALNATGAAPVAYLMYEGLLEPPSVAASPAAPTSGVPPATQAYNARAECIIAKESGGANIANRRGSGAVGVAQYMPSTFAAHAREIGHPEYSPWNPAQARAVAAHDLALGRRSQWSVGGC